MTDETKKRIAQAIAEIENPDVVHAVIASICYAEDILQEKGEDAKLFTLRFGELAAGILYPV